MLEELAAKLDEHGLQAIVVARSDGTEVARIGDVTTLPWPDLADSLFGDEERIRNLYHSLVGRLLPQTWRQGEVHCIVSRLEPQAVVFGAFRTTTDDGLTAYHRANAICSDVSDVIARHASADKK